MSSDFCPPSATNFFYFSKTKVLINGKTAKPSSPVKAGDVVEVLYASGSLKFRICEVKETVKKDEAASLYEVIR